MADLSEKWQCSVERWDKVHMFSNTALITRKSKRQVWKPCVPDLLSTVEIVASLLVVLAFIEVEADPVDWRLTAASNSVGHEEKADSDDGHRQPDTERRASGQNVSQGAVWVEH